MLPSASAVGEGGEISDRELDAVPGGGTWGGDTGVPPPAIAAKGPAGARYRNERGFGRSFAIFARIRPGMLSSSVFVPEGTGMMTNRQRIDLLASYGATGSEIEELLAYDT